MGKKQYELTNHLGNVLAVVNDTRTGVDSDANGSFNYYEPDVLASNEYYPFGMNMPGSRSYALGGATAYRYGFNGKEKDPKTEWGGLNQYDYGFRIYNPALGRWLSLDPLQKKYPSLSPYSYAANSPILLTDPDGRAIINPFKNLQFISPLSHRSKEILANTASWTSTLKNWDTGGGYDRLGIDLNFGVFGKAVGRVDINGETVTKHGITAISVVVAGESIALEDYTGTGGDIDRYVVNVSFFSQDDNPNILVTAAHEVGTHALTLSDQIAAVKSGTTTFSAFQENYIKMINDAKNDPIGYKSQDHTNIGNGTAETYNSITHGIIDMLKASKDKLNKLEKSYDKMTIRTAPGGEAVDRRQNYGPAPGTGEIIRHPYTHEKVEDLIGREKADYAPK